MHVCVCGTTLTRCLIVVTESAQAELQDMFGSIRTATVDRLLTLARQLHSVSVEQIKRPESRATAASRNVQSFGSSIVFHQPASVDFLMPILAQLQTQEPELPSKPEQNEEKDEEEEEEPSPTDVLQQLLDICTSHVVTTSSPMAPATLAIEIAEICANEGEDGDLQGRMFELLGAEGFEAMFLIVELAGAIRASVRTNPSTWRKKIQSPAAETTTEPESFAMSSSNFSVMTQSQRNKHKQNKKKTRKLKQQDIAQASTAGDGSTDWLASVGFDTD